MADSNWYAGQNHVVEEAHRAPLALIAYVDEAVKESKLPSRKDNGHPC